MRIDSNKCCTRTKYCPAKLPPINSPFHARNIQDFISVCNISEPMVRLEYPKSTCHFMVAPPTCSLVRSTKLCLFFLSRLRDLNSRLTLSFEPTVGLEPTTCSLRKSYSTTELRWHTGLKMSHIQAQDYSTFLFAKKQALLTAELRQLRKIKLRLRKSYSTICVANCELTELHRQIFKRLPLQFILSMKLNFRQKTFFFTKA